MIREQYNTTCQSRRFSCSSVKKKTSSINFLQLPNISHLSSQRGATSKIYEDLDTSASKRKINYNDRDTTEFDESGNRYILLHEESFSNMLNALCCPECRSSGVTHKLQNRQGLSHTVVLHCPTCDSAIISTATSPTVEPYKHLDVNSRMVAAMRSYRYWTCRIARILPFLQHGKEIIDIAVTYDGTWQKRGHTSHHGAFLVVDLLTGLILDYVVLSNYCQECTLAKQSLGADSAEFAIWFEGHESHCYANHTGSAGSMEAAGALILWKRSISKTKMSYMTVLSDGDTKTVTQLNEKVYGTDEINKEEVNHISKRMFAALKSFVDASKNGHHITEMPLCVTTISKICRKQFGRFSHIV